jgi:hypothetical protein
VADAVVWRMVEEAEGSVASMGKGVGTEPVS